MKSLLISFLFVFPALAWGQKITGQIADDKGKPVAFASVMLLHAKDSTLAKGAVTDAEGKFELESIEKGKYFVRASAVGLKNVESALFDWDNNDLNIPTLSMSTLTTELQSVTVAARKPMIEVKPDKTVFNVEGSINAVGNDGLELLRKSPNVTVDKDDNISLKGKSGVRIYIDGRPSQLSGKDLAALLKSINSADIEAIELISNPGAMYDAQGSAGVINIKLKKNKKLGSSGNVALGASFGITPKYNASISLNHRDKKVNFFSNYSYNQGRWHNDLKLFTRIDSLRYDQISKHYNENSSHNIKIGADVYLSKHHTIGTVITGNWRDGMFHNDGRTPIGRYEPYRIDSILVATSDIASQNRNLNYNLNYRFTDTFGRSLAIDADYGTFTGRSDAYQPNFYKNPNESAILTTLIYRNNTPVDILIRTLKADYEQKLGKGKLGLGAKISNVISDNTFNFFNVIGNQDVLNIDKSNTFKYNELVSAAYVNYNQTFGKIGLNLGLRGEHSRIQGDLKSFKPQQPNEKVDSAYLNLFPNIGISWEMNAKNAFNLSYRRSLERPNYQDLNPFEFRLDELTFQKGNPFLRPQYSHTIELGHTFMQFLNTSIGYTRTNDLFIELIDSRQEVLTKKNYMFQTKENLAKVDNYSFSVNAPLPLAKWWMGNLNFWLNNAHYQAHFGDNKTVNLSATAYGFWMQHSITLGKGFTYEISGWYNSPSVWSTMRSKAQGMMDMGIQKTFWNKDATVKLSFNDVFRTARWAGIIQLGNLINDASGTWEGRLIRLNFNYRFGNKEVRGSQRKTGSEEEAKRIKQ